MKRMTGPPDPPIPPTCWGDQPWEDPCEYITINDGLPVLPILIGTIAICLAGLTIMLLLAAVSQ